MKAEVLIQKQFEEAKAAWAEEKHALQAEINSLKERLVGKVIEDSKPDLGAIKAAALAEQENVRKAKEAAAEAKKAKAEEVE